MLDMKRTVTEGPFSHDGTQSSSGDTKRSTDCAMSFMKAGPSRVPNVLSELPFVLQASQPLGRPSHSSTRCARMSSSDVGMLVLSSRWSSNERVINGGAINSFSDSPTPLPVKSCTGIIQGMLVQLRPTSSSTCQSGRCANGKTLAYWFKTKSAPPSVLEKELNEYWCLALSSSTHGGTQSPRNMSPKPKRSLAEAVGSKGV
mmetsp:Transcript_64740/g.128005  ORF Transcript_64740/g.128005 Transcript_64740/m.128005 type:complete len:202 (+) Transcript_64740:282-887(+)